MAACCNSLTVIQIINIEALLISMIFIYHGAERITTCITNVPLTIMQGTKHGITHFNSKNLVMLH